MKTFKLFTLFSVFSLVIVFNGCSDDEWGDDRIMELSIDGKSIVVNDVSGSIINGSLYVKFHLSERKNIYLHGKYRDDDAAGKYIYSEDEKYGTFYISDNMDRTYTDGSLKVESQKDKYAITFTGKTEDGTVMKGYYRGTVYPILIQPNE